MFLAQPWLVLEEDEWCMNGTVGSLSVAPQHELNVYLTEVFFPIHVFVFVSVFCIARVHFMLTAILERSYFFPAFFIGSLHEKPGYFLFV